MPTRPRSPGLPPAPRFRYGIVTHPVRLPDGAVRHVSVPIDFPPHIDHQGRRFRETGRLGYRTADRVQAAEYADSGGQRVWLAADGTVVGD